MITKLLSCVFLCLIYTTTSLGQSSIFDQQWKAIDSLEHYRLVDSAFDKTTQLLASIKANPQQKGWQAHYIKALIFKYKYQARILENQPLPENTPFPVYQEYCEQYRQPYLSTRSIINPLIGELQQLEKETSDNVQKALAAYTIGSFLDDFYSDYRSCIHARDTSYPFDANNIEHWSADRFLQNIDAYYQKAFNYPIVRQTGALPYVLLSNVTESFKEFGLDTLKKRLPYTWNLRTTLYDLLGHHYLNYIGKHQMARASVYRARPYIKELRGEINPPDIFAEPTIVYWAQDSAAFLPLQEFLATDFALKDTTIIRYQKLQIYQQLLALHQKNKNLEALADLDYSRLQYALLNCSHSAAKELYKSTLTTMAKTYKKQAVYGEIAYQFADKAYNKKNYKEAYQLCQEVKELHPNSFAIASCNRLIQRITQPNITLAKEIAYLPKKPILVQLYYQNVDTLYAKLVRLPYTYLQPHDSLLNKWKTTATSVHLLPNFGDFKGHTTELSFAGLPTGHYRLILSKNPNFTTKENTILYTTIQVTDLALVQQNHELHPDKLFVLSRSTGKPIKNARVSLELQKDRKTVHVTAKTAEDGSLAIAKDQHYMYKKAIVRYQKDQFNSVCSSNSYNTSCHLNSIERSKNTSFKAQLFTDRAIYRPGQTLYFKGVLWEHLPNGELQVAANQETTVNVYDVNRQKIKSFTFITNEYGSYSDSVLLPTNTLLGRMTLKDELAEQHQKFSVEEYKKPTFEVSFKDKYKTVIYYDTVKVTGTAKTFLGSNLDGASVRYTVSMPTTIAKTNRTEIDSIIKIGNTLTDKDGEFTVTFEALTDTFHPRYYQYYTIKAEVTDLTGETKTCSKEVRSEDSAYYYRDPGEPPLGEVYLVTKHIKLSTPKARTNDLNITLQGYVKVHDGAVLKSTRIHPLDNITATVTVEKLKMPKYPYYRRYWGKIDTNLLSQEDFQRQFPYFAYQQENNWNTWAVEKSMLEQTVQFQKDTFKYLTPDASQWEQGSYRIRVIYNNTTQRNPTKDTIIQNFVLTDPTNSKVPFNDPLFILDQNQTGYPGDTIWIDLGSVYKNAQVLFSLEHNEQVIQNNWIKLNGRKKLPIYIQNKHRGGIHYHLLTIRDNRVHHKAGVIHVPWDDKQLKVEYLSFRNKLLPGQQEEWQIKISGLHKDKVAAEVLATLYDAALDQLAYHQWNKHYYPRQTELSTSWESKNNFNSQRFKFSSSFGATYYNYYRNPAKAYLQLSDLKYFYRFNKRWAKAGERWLDTDKDGVVDYLEESESAMLAGYAEKSSATSGFFHDLQPDINFTANNTTNNNNNYLRKDLRETIFFFPHLQTDAEGNVIIKFKMGENLSRWKFMLYAHSKELQQVLSSKTLVTQKKLMIKPNPPRFLKEGDAIEFVAKVINLDDSNLSGEASLQLFDALTMQSIDAAWANTTAKVAFAVNTGESQRVSWDIKVPNNWTTPITYRVVAKAANIADGEEASLPVHSSRILLSEAFSLYTKGSTTDNFVFKRMQNNSTTLQHHRLTLEFTPNPVWYAVQSIPYLIDYPYDCSEQLFAKYYANSLASAVINSHPKIKEALAHFAEVGEPASNDRLAQLKANPQLKSAILEETPWVLASKSKKQKYKELNTLFDLNSMAAKAEQVRDKLLERQSKDGGFAWFPGGNGNAYITQYIVAGMGHLSAMDANLLGDDHSTQNMLYKAVQFLDAEFIKQYINFKKNAELSPSYQQQLRTHQPSPQTIHYLYTRTFFKQLNYQENREIAKAAVQYYSQQCEKHWNKQTLYTQAMIALTLHRLDNKNSTAQIIMDSIRSKAVYSDREGMYWKQDWGYYWHNQCIETHTQLIEAFGEIKKDTQAVEAIKQWILQQRIDGHWTTTKSTTLATYALLKTGQNWLADPKPVDIQLGGQPISTPDGDRAEDFSGYFEKSWEGKDVSKDMANIKVSNPNPFPVMGAIHWQYFEQLDKVTSFKDTPLQLSRQLYKEITTPQGVQLIAVDSTTITPGDLLKVKITLTAEKAMEYLHLKDMRAAGFEPVNVLSEYKRIGYNMGYYESTKDAATHFFFDYLPKGTYTFEYPLRVQHKGNFTNGVATIQCMYAPEFTSHSKGIRIEVK